MVNLSPAKSSVNPDPEAAGEDACSVSGDEDGSRVVHVYQKGAFAADFGAGSPPSSAGSRGNGSTVYGSVTASSSGSASPQ